MSKFTLKQLSDRAKVASRAEKAYKMPPSLRRKPTPKQKTLYFKGAKELSLNEHSEKAFVKVVNRAYEKFGKDNVEIAHQNNPNNATSDWVDRMSKKHGFKQSVPTPVESFGSNNGFKARETAIQKAIDSKKIIPISVDKQGVIGLGKQNQELYNKAWKQGINISKETKINEKGKVVSKWRKSKFGKNTQQNTALQALIDERQDLKLNPKEVQATDELLKGKQDFIRKKGNESGKINTHYAVEEGIAPEEGTTIRKEIDDYNESAKPRKKVVISNPRVPYRRDYWAKTLGLGKPQIVKLPDVADTSVNRQFIENFDQEVDEVAKLTKGKKQGEALINYSEQDTTNKKNVPKGAVNKGTLLTSTNTAPKSTRLSRLKTFQIGDSNIIEVEFTKDENPANIRAKSIKEFTDTSMDVDSSSDKTKSGSGMGTHKKSHLERIELEDKQDLKNVERQVKLLRDEKSINKSIDRKNRRLIATKSKLPQVKGVSLINEFPDSLAREALSEKPGAGTNQTKSARSATTYDKTIKDVPIPKNNKLNQVNKVKADVANIDSDRKYPKKLHGLQKIQLTPKPARRRGKTSVIKKGYIKGNPQKSPMNYKGQRAFVGASNFVGGFSLLSSILAPLVARKKAKEYTGKKNPSTMDAFKMAYPQVLGLPRKKGQRHWSDPS